MLSERQYGFIKARSTTDVVKRVIDVSIYANEGSWSTRELCVLITLDVGNAFNSASSYQIMDSLRRKGINGYLYNIVGSYFSARKIILEDGEKMKKMDMTCGVQQGPLLWNVLYDDVLSLEQLKGVVTIAYADDLAMVALAKTREELITHN